MGALPLSGKSTCCSLFAFIFISILWLHVAQNETTNEMKLKYVHKVSMWSTGSQRKVGRVLGGWERRGGGGAESRASTIRKSGVEIRNFARHHQRETFPTSWAIGRSSTAEPVDLVRWGQGRGALTPTQKPRRHCHLCRASSLLWWWFRMQPQSPTWTALTAHSGNKNNSNMNNNNNNKRTASAGVREYFLLGTARFS